MTFQAPIFLPLLLLVPLFILWYRFFRKKKNQEALKFSDISTLKFIGAEVKPWRQHLAFALNLLLLTLFVVAVCKPQGLLSTPSSQLAVAICLDTSGSMTATDFFPSRIEAAKEAAKGFVKHQTLRFPIGVLTFSDAAMVRLEPTSNQTEILSAIDQVEAHLGGTAIGDAIFSSMNLLSGMDVANKVILLLSDGENNRGSDPILAAKTAQQANIKIYTIGVGTPEGANIPGIPEVVRVDEKTLQAIADITGGEYHRVTDSETLQKIFVRLSRVIRMTKRYGDITWYFVAAGLVLLCVKLGLEFTLLRRFP